jgi:hypothetical protein
VVVLFACTTSLGHAHSLLFYYHPGFGPGIARPQLQGLGWTYGLPSLVISPNKPSSQIGGREDQYKRNPGSQQTGKHLETTVDQHGDHKKIHKDDKRNEDHRSL